MFNRGTGLESVKSYGLLSFLFGDSHPSNDDKGDGKWTDGTQTSEGDATNTQNP